MNRLINRLVSQATAPVGEMSTRLFKKAALIFAAMSCLFVGAIFLTIALFVFVQPLAGTAIAALGTGALYLGVTIICIIVASRGSKSQATPAAVASGPIPETTGNSTSQKRAFESNIDEAVAPILEVLRDSGRDRERRVLEAGAEIAKQLNPFALAALAILAGFILSRILKQRWRLPG
jgi:Putative Actinobacterial Holin-X, holin superfamily III